jgi:hypothetical protein
MGLPLILATASVWFLLERWVLRASNRNSLLCLPSYKEGSIFHTFLLRQLDFRGAEREGRTKRLRELYSALSYIVFFYVLWFE